MKSVTRPALAALAIAALALTACSSKASQSETTTDNGVKTGAGISGGHIKLGMITDLSGAFAAIGKELSQSAKVYWDQVNDKGGVCGKFPVDIDVQDSGYDVQNTVSLYKQMSPNVLGFPNILGSAHTLALNDSLKADSMLVVTHGQGTELLGYPNIITTGATFDIEGANGLGYLYEQGKIKDGDTIGSLHLEGTYGDAVLAGIKSFASAHDMKVVDTQIGSTDSDMSSAVTDMASKHISALVFSGTPPQLASAAGATATAGLDIPILASTPSWASALLDTPAAPVLKKNVTVVFPTDTFETPQATDFRNAYLKAYPNQNPSLQILLEYSENQAFDDILEKACSDGDLTREGVMAAKDAIGTVTEDGITPPLDFSNPAKPATAAEFVTSVSADTPGGLKLVKGPYTSDEGQALWDSK